MKKSSRDFFFVLSVVANIITVLGFLGFQARIAMTLVMPG
jgi:hypothetical protein